LQGPCCKTNQIWIWGVCSPLEDPATVDDGWDPDADEDAELAKLAYEVAYQVFDR
jgi:hypothetical protein